MRTLLITNNVCRFCLFVSSGTAIGSPCNIIPRRWTITHIASLSLPKHAECLFIDPIGFFSILLSVRYSVQSPSSLTATVLSFTTTTAIKRLCLCFYLIAAATSAELCPATMAHIGCLPPQIPLLLFHIAPSATLLLLFVIVLIVFWRLLPIHWLL